MSLTLVPFFFDSSFFASERKTKSPDQANWSGKSYKDKKINADLIFYTTDRKPVTLGDVVPIYVALSVVQVPVPGFI